MKTTNINKKGKSQKTKKLVVGTCKFPFKYKKEVHKKCILGDNGDWCATSLTKNGYVDTWAYCLKSKIKQKPKKIIKSNKPKIVIKKTPKKQLTSKSKIVIKKTPKKQLTSKSKKPVQKPLQKDIKELVIHELTLMRKGVSFKQDRWRVIAYNKAIKAIKEYNGKITNAEDLRKLHGVGEKIVLKVEEILKTGKLKAANIIRKDKTITAVSIIGNVVNIGPVKAKELVEKHKIKTIEELRKNQHLLNNKQKIGLKYYESLMLKIPRTEMDKHNNFLQKIMKSIDSKAILTTVGSYRRLVKSSGDIDVLLTHPQDKDIFKPFVDSLLKTNYVKDVLSYGNKKCSAVVEISKGKMRRLDILFTKKSEYPFALFYFTGSGTFNQVIRKKANELGYKLNEYGIKKTGSNDYISNIKNEQDIFRMLKVKYLEPKDRYTGNIVNL